eukprot:gene31187-142_t
MLLSSSTDCSVKLHRADDGVFVGWFGMHTWDIRDPATWQGTAPVPAKPPPSHPQPQRAAAAAAAAAPRAGGGDV